jgi:hypothetical protein
MVEAGQKKFTDHCGFGSTQEIVEKLNTERNEQVLFSCKVLKFNRFNMKQERDLLVTNLYVYNIKNKKIKRPIGIQKLMAFTISSAPGIKEFIIHVKQDYDYRFISEEFMEIKDALKYQFNQLTDKNLPVYIVNNSKLRDYETSKKDMRRGYDNKPEQQFIAESENIFAERGSIASDSTDNTQNKSGGMLDDSTDSIDSSFMRDPSKTIYAKAGDQDVNLQSFHFIKVIGRGSFGKVFLVKKKNTDNYYAMKSLRKDVIIDYDQVESTKLEKEILLQADHPFLVGMHYVF